MNNSDTYRVSLSVMHPTLSVDDISPSFSFRTRYEKSVGARRIATNGSELGGVYPQTNISFDISDGVINYSEMLVEKFIENSMTKLPLSKIKKLVASGGICFLLIGIFAEKNVMCVFELDLLSQLQQHGIGLKFDFYGGPNVKPQA